MCEMGPLADKICRWIMIGILIFSWVFWVVSVGHCSFIRGGVENNRQSIGLFGIGIEDEDGVLYTCRRYTDDELDKDEYVNDSGHAARAFGAIGVTLHSVACLMVICLTLWVKTCARVFWWIARGFFIVSIICGLLVFMIFGIEFCTEEDTFGKTDCKAGGAGIVASFNVFLMTAVVTFSWILGAPKHPIFRVTIWKDEDDEGEGEEEQEQARQPKRNAKHSDEEAAIVTAKEVLPVGSPQDNTASSTEQSEDVVTIKILKSPQGKKTIKEVLHPDGSKTVTMTFEEIEEDGVEMMEEEGAEEEGAAYAVKPQT